MKFGSGYWIGFKWLHGGDGWSSRSSAVLAARHHPDSITWQWAVYWQQPAFVLRHAWPLFFKNFCPGLKSFYLRLPFWMGTISFQYQGHLWRSR